MISLQKVLQKEIITSQKVLEHEVISSLKVLQLRSFLPCLAGVGGSNLRANREKEEKSDMCQAELIYWWNGKTSDIC